LFGAVAGLFGYSVIKLAFYLLFVAIHFETEFGRYLSAFLFIFLSVNYVSSYLDNYPPHQRNTLSQAAELWDSWSVNSFIACTWKCTKRNAQACFHRLGCPGTVSSLDSICGNRGVMSPYENLWPHPHVTSRAELRHSWLQHGCAKRQGEKRQGLLM
jgi:hypothetical protein